MKINIKDDVIKKIIATDLEKAKRWQEDLRPKREQNLLLYSMSKEADGIKQMNIEGFSATVNPMIYKSVEGMKVSLDQLFTSPDFFEIKIGEDLEAGERVRKLLRWNIFENQYGARQLRFWLDTVLKYEYAVLKTYWSEEYREERESFDRLDQLQAEELLKKGWAFDSYDVIEDYATSFDDFGNVQYNPVMVGMENVKGVKKVPTFIGVRIEAVDPETFFYSPDSTSLDECRLVAQKILLKAEDIKRTEKEGKYRKGSYKKALMLNYADDEYAENIQYRYTYDELDNPYDNINFIEEKGNLPNKPITIWEIYINIDIENKGYAEPVIVHMLENKEILSIEKNTYGRPPFRVGRAIESPYKFEGIAYPQALKQVQIELTQQQRLFNNATADSVYGNLLTSDPELAENWRKRILGDVLLASKTTMQNREYDIVRGSGADPTILQAKEMLEGLGEEVSGITRYNQGLDADSLNSTARGISIITSMSQQRQRFMANVISETWKDVLEDMVQAFKLFGAEYIEYFKRKGLEIVPSDYQNDFSVNIELGIGQQERQSQAGVIRELIALGQNGGIQSGLMSMGHIAKAIDKLGQLLNVPLTQYHYTEEEIKQNEIQKQQQQQAMIQQQLMQQQAMQEQAMEIEKTKQLQGIMKNENS